MFVIYFPYRFNWFIDVHYITKIHLFLHYISRPKYQCARQIPRNHYATRFEDSWAVAKYVQNGFTRLEAETCKFHDALFGSTLPSYVLDAVSANIVPLRSTSTTCSVTLSVGFDQRGLWRARRRGALPLRAM